MRRAPLWLRALLRLHPPGFRRSLGADLLQTFAVERKRARESGPVAHAAFLARTVLSMAGGAVAERRRERRLRRSRGRAHSRQGDEMLTTWLLDAKVAARSLFTRSPGFTAMSIATIALGVGANTTVFSVVDGVLLRPLPFPDADELVQVWEVFEHGGTNSVAGANFLDWRDQSRSFEVLVARSNPQYGSLMTVLGLDESARVNVAQVSEGFFSMMDVDPALGRPLVEGDYEPDAPVVVVASYGFWERRMGAPADLSQHTLDIGSTPVAVVGVMPPEFDYPDDAELWAPLAITPGGSRTAHNWLVNGRLRDGVSVAQAQAELAAITARLRAEYGSDMNAVSAAVVPLREQLYGALSGPLKLLLGAAAFVLLVACTNLASALLARGHGRARELSVRAALGASRGRVVRYLLTENVIIAAAGAVAGALVAVPALRVFLAAGPPLIADEVRLDLRVFLVTFAVSVATVLVFGFLPAALTTRGSLAQSLRDGDRGGARRRGGVWSVLVAAETGLTLVLLAGSAVLARSFARVLALDRGFEASSVITADVSFPSSVYAGDPERSMAQRRVLDAVRAVPGVASAGLVNHLPLSGMAFNGGFEMEGSGPVSASVDYRVASPGYLETMGVPVLEGRAFTESDDAGVGDVALVSRSMADRFWPGESPVGRRIRNLANDSWLYPDRWITIVGVVGDVRHRALVEPPVPTVYVNAAQRPSRAGSPILVARTRGDAPGLAAAVRAAIRAAAPDVPVETLTMADRVSASVTDRRFNLLVLGSFAAIALGLAAVGVYGVVSYAVARRTREMGIRLALGAERGVVYALVMRGSLGPVALGAVAGVMLALALGRFLERLVYDVRPTDPLSLVLATAGLLAVATAATWIPARRATRVDPVTTMRAE